MLDVSRKRKKYRKETHEKKIVKEKKSEKKEKFKSKECVSCEKKNRSMGENEGKMGQKEYICPYIFFLYML